MPPTRAILGSLGSPLMEVVMAASDQPRSKTQLNLRRLLQEGVSVVGQLKPEKHL
jgi:hypothetical protein